MTTGSARYNWSRDHDDLASWYNEFVLRRELSMSEKEYHSMGPFKQEFWLNLLEAESDKIRKEIDKQKRRHKR